MNSVKKGLNASTESFDTDQLACSVQADLGRDFLIKNIQFSAYKKTILPHDSDGSKK